MAQSINTDGLSLFFHPEKLSMGDVVPLTEETARHATQVLRMKEGHELLLTNGEGNLCQAEIICISKKKVEVKVLMAEEKLRQSPTYHLAVAFTKNTSRNEWMLEKATELGVASIIPLITCRSLRERYREDRWKGIIASAMLQSQQIFLPKLSEPRHLEEVIKDHLNGSVLIAHCIADLPKEPILQAIPAGKDLLLLIGPEGDFTKEEVDLVIEKGGKSISLGNTRLRTETAAIAACAAFHLQQSL